MKIYVLIFLLTGFATASTSSFTVARIGISQGQIRDLRFHKESKNTLTLGIGRRYYTSESNHSIYGFDVVYSQTDLTTKTVSYPSSDLSSDTNVEIRHFDIIYANFEIPILVGYSSNTVKKNAINIEAGPMLSFAYKMDYISKVDNYIYLTDEEREKYNFDFAFDEYYEPNPLSLNLLISINIKHRFGGLEFRYRRALSKIGNIESLPNQYIDSFYVNMMFFF